MVKGRTRKFLISGVFGAILMAVFAASFSRSANATQFDMSIKSYMTVDFPSFIFIDASPNYGGIQTADARLRVSTNEGGYVAIVSANGSSAGMDDVSYTDLVNVSENAKIPTLTSNKTKLEFPVGYWGYSLDGGENYRGMAAYNDANRLTLSSEQGASNTTDFTFGVKIDDVQPAGIYNNTILVTVVPTMEEVPEPTEIHAKALVGANGHLVFVYDDKHYEVGDAYVTETVNTAIEGVHYIPTMASSTADIGWASNANIQTVDIEETFKYFHPLNTRYWFYGLSGLTKINGINNIDMSGVTSTNYMFSYAHLAHEIEDLDVSNVTNMYHMFDHFCQGGCDGSLNLERWDVSRVQNMQGLFYYVNTDVVSGSNNAVDVASGIRYWDVSSVTNMSYMFYAAYYSSNYDHTNWSLYFDLSNWDTSKVTNMQYMFAYVAAGVSSRNRIWVSIDMDNLDVRMVQNAQGMFYYTATNDSFSLVANNWQLDSVTNVSNMFYGVDHAFGYYTLKLHGWKIRNNVTPFSIGAQSENATSDVDIDISDWSVPNPGNWLKGMIVKSGRANSWRMDISGWNTSSITDFSELFANIGYHNGGWGTFYLNVTGWNTSRVTNMSKLFYRSFFRYVTIVGIESWDTSNVTDMHQAFLGFGGNTYYRRDEDYYNRWNYYESAGGYGDSTIKYGLDNWTFGKVTDMSSMFELAGTNRRILDTLEGANVSKVVSMSRMFYGTGMYAPVDLGGWDVSSVALMTEMFMKARIGSLNLYGWHTNSLINIDGMFKNTLSSSGTTINLDNLDVARITSFKELFSGFNTNSTDSMTIRMNGWDTRNAVDMSYMFSVSTSCGPIALVGFTAINTSNVTNMAYMFQNFSVDASVWNYDFSGLDTSSVLDMSYMFSGIEHGASSVAVDFSSLDTSSVLDMNHMFSGAATNATTVSMSFGGDFDTSSVHDMKYMFYETGKNASTFSLDLSDFNTGNVQDMSYMLFNAGKLAANFSVDITGWDVSNVYEREYFCDRLELVQPNWQ